MARPIQYVFAVRDLSAICANQTTGASGNLTINGTYMDQTALGVGVQRANLPGGYGYGVTLQSSGDVSTVSFTIYGLDVYGQTVSSAVSGPNNSIVTTGTEYACVTRVASDAAVGTNTRVGIGGHGTSRPMTVDTFMNPVSIDVGVEVTATATTSLQSCDDDLNVIIPAGNGSSAVWGTLASVSNVTTNTISTLCSPHRFLRSFVSGANATGTVTTTLTQAGY